MARRRTRSDQCGVVAGPPMPQEALDVDAVARVHGGLVEIMQRRGVADVQRHQEDLLGRPLLAFEEVASIGAARLGRLGAARAQAIAHVRHHMEPLRRRRERLNGELQAIASALLDAGDREATVSLPPQASPDELKIRLAFGAALLACLIALGFALATGNQQAGLGGLALAAVLAWTAVVWRSDSLESRKLTSLRRSYRRTAIELENVDGEINAWNTVELGVIERSLYLASVERALPCELLSAYSGAVIRGMPPGALSDGAGLPEVADPTPALPEWAQQTIEEPVL
jgi:hypothetical protein